MKKSIDNILKLINFELERISKFLFGLMGITLISNLIAYFYVPFRFMSRINKFMSENSASVEEALEIFGTFSFADMIHSFWIIGPIALGIAGMLFYSVFTWYREWFGKNTFVYRLMMLPIERMNIFFSKLITIFIGIFALLSTQMVSLAVGYPIVSMIINSDFFHNLSLMEAIHMNMSFHYLFPINIRMFLTVNGIGLIFLLILFTIILMERSFGIKGILIGIFYGGIALSLIIFPVFIPNFLKNYYILYNSELILIEILLFIVVGLVSIFISRYLINNKITV